MTTATHIQAPPPRKRAGCFGCGCLTLVIGGILLLGAIGVGGYFFVNRGYLADEPAAIPVEELPPEQLAEARQRIEDFKAGTPTQPVAPSSTTSAPAPAGQRQISGAEINGLIAANKRARGHAYVTLQGNTATIQVSIPVEKLGLDGRYLNGSFVIKTNGPTRLQDIEISKVEANGLPLPSNVLHWQYRGRSLIGYAVDALEPYNVKTLEIRDGNVIGN
jgi:hypothetical protein